MEETVYILFACVAANHLGLVGAAERTLGFRLPIVNCSKCLAFWVTMAYGLAVWHIGLKVFAVSFLNAYLALWVELGMGYIDTLYDKCYEAIYPRATDNAPPSDGGARDTGGQVSELR